MTNNTTKPDSLQPAAEMAVDLFDNWFDPLEAEVRARSRQFIEELLRVELAAEQFFDELTRSSPHFGLKRIKPVVKKINSHFGRWLQRIRLRCIVRHGVVSSPTLQRRMIRG